MKPHEAGGHTNRQSTYDQARLITPTPAFAGVLAFLLSGVFVYMLTLTWLPPAQAATDTAALPTNVQTTQLLSYRGGANILDSAPLPGMVVVADTAIQPDLGIYDVNDSGFLEDVPEINVIPESRTKNETLTHIVAPGETLSGIAGRYGIKLDTVLWANDLTSKSTLRAGTELTILPVDGVQYTVKNGDTLSGIATKFQASSSEIADFNAIDPSRLSVGAKLIIPGGKGVVSAPRITTKSTLKSATARVTAGQVIDGLQLPTTGVVSQGYGPSSFAKTSGYYKNNEHLGVDIANKTGTPIYAAHDGTVVLASTLRGYGKVVYLKGKDTLGRTVFTRYGHLTSYNVSKHQVVSAGEQIGLMGSTGRSTGPHLHFEIRNASNEQWESHQFYQMYWGY